MSDHDREWIIGCIKHDGFIKTDRFDKANHIILDALEKNIDAEIARLSRPTDLISRADAIEAVCKGCHWWSGQCDNDKAFRCDEVCRIEALPSADAEWIPCSERLPKAEDMYRPPEQRYLCQLEAYGEKTFCVLSRLKGAVSPFWDWYGVAVHDSEVIAWMPLPKPYREDGEE